MTPPHAAIPDETPLWAHTRSGLAFADVAERPGGRMPDFCIIGAAKAGTTSIDNYLGQHPDIFVCPLKEPHYFSTDAIFARGPQWYRGLYADAKDGQILGEASTSYTRFPAAAETPVRIKAANPEMKLIYVLREPVARVESECLQTMKYARHVAGIEDFPGSVDETLDYLEGAGRALGTLPVDTSEYIAQINRYLAHFPRAQMLIILQEDINQCPEETMRAVFAFLGVDPEFKVDMSARLNTTSDFVDGVKQTKSLSKLKRLPLYDLARNALPGNAKDWLRRQLGKGGDARQFKLSIERREKLRAYFAPLNRELATFLGRDLSHWS